MNSKTRKWFSIVAVFLVMGLVLAACGPQEEGGAGLDQTPLATAIFETPAIDEPVLDTPIGTTPVVEETAIVETPMVETPEVIETEAISPTVEMMETPEVTPTVTLEATTGDTMALIRAGQLLGMNIMDRTGEQVGEISDVLITQNGDIRYLVFDAGGFLGIDARTSIVEWDNFEPETAETADTLGAGTNVTGTIETPAAGTPAAGERTGTMSAHRIENILFVGQVTDVESSPEIDTALFNSSDLFIDAAELELPTEFDRLMRVSQFAGFSLLDYDLVNQQDEDLGEIEDLLLDLTNGRVVYVLADVGGFLGLAERTIAIPWEQIAFDQTDGNFVLNSDREMLENAPELDLDLLDENNFVTQDWDLDVRDFWENQ